MKKFQNHDRKGNKWYLVLCGILKAKLLNFGLRGRWLRKNNTTFLKNGCFQGTKRMKIGARPYFLDIILE